MKDLKKIISNNPQEHFRLFKKLRNEQNPHTLFITCSDSRIIPNIITSSKPGDLFLIRNVGNVVPTPDSSAISVLAAIEYAIHILKIEDIVICGHSNCGAIDAVCNGNINNDCENLSKWLQHIKITNTEVSSDFTLNKEDLASQANVLQQVKNLSEHSFINKKVTEKKLELHAWWFNISTLKVSYFSIDSKSFLEY